MALYKHFDSNGNVYYDNKPEHEPGLGPGGQAIVVGLIVGFIVICASFAIFDAKGKWPLWAGIISAIITAIIYAGIASQKSDNP